MALEESRRLVVERLVRLILFVSASILAIFIGLENLTHVAAVLGLALAGSAIALKDVFLSFIGWLMLVFTRQIKVGDFVEIGGISGKVLEISILKYNRLGVQGFSGDRADHFFRQPFDLQPTFVQLQLGKKLRLG